MNTDGFQKARAEPHATATQGLLSCAKRTVANRGAGWAPGRAIRAKPKLWQDTNRWYTLLKAYEEGLVT